MSGRVLKTLYDLRYHDLGGWSLHRWLVTLLVLGAIVSLWQGRSRLLGWHGLVAALLMLAAVGMVLLERRARARSFVRFQPDGVSSPPPEPLAPEEEIPVCASGHFEVQRKVALFAGLQARFTTFATREHAVMAGVPDARMLLVGRTPETHVGMWYIFFRPEQLCSIVSGTLSFGRRRHPALQVTFELLPDPERPRRAGSPRQADVFLAFDDPGARARVWADLLAG